MRKIQNPKLVSKLSRHLRPDTMERNLHHLQIGQQSGKLKFKNKLRSKSRIEELDAYFLYKNIFI